MEIKVNKLDIIVWPTFLIIENYKKIILSSRKMEVGEKNLTPGEF